jgi:hypothetical protein
MKDLLSEYAFLEEFQRAISTDWICLEVVWMNTSWLGNLALFFYKMNFCTLSLLFFSVLEVHMRPTLKAYQFTFSQEYG